MLPVVETDRRKRQQYFQQHKNINNKNVDIIVR